MPDDKHSKKIHQILKSKKTKFTDLFYMTEMDPAIDCRYADLRGSNFARQELIRFDFTGSDLRGSRFDGALFNDVSFQNAIMIEFDDHALNALIYQYSSARYLAQSAIISPNYYDRTAAIGLFYMKYDHSQFSSLADYIEGKDKSSYVRILIKKISEISQSETDINTKKVRIAAAMQRNSYPLARRQLHNSIEQKLQYVPELKSFI